MGLTKELSIFKKTHQKKHKEISGINWEYFVSGKGPETILMIHGGTGSAESIFRYTEMLEKNFRVITPTIPTEIITVEKTLVGIETILKTEKINKKIHCIGFSLGGMVEQVFLRKHLDLVKTLTLFHVPSPSKSYAKFIKRTVKINQMMPQWLPSLMGKFYMKKEFPKQYSNISEEERNFWIDYYTKNSSKKRTVNQMKIVVDFLSNYRFEKSDLENWRGKVLIFETSTDTMIPEIERDRLKQIYPNAIVYTFFNGSHLGNGLFKLNVVIPIIKDFLLKNK
jgi:pimeloyl-ACP methyl ester carboxylesterase